MHVNARLHVVASDSAQQSSDLDHLPLVTATTQTELFVLKRNAPNGVYTEGESTLLVITTTITRGTR